MKLILQYICSRSVFYYYFYYLFFFISLSLHTYSIILVFFFFFFNKLRNFKCVWLILFFFKLNYILQTFVIIYFHNLVSKGQSFATKLVVALGYILTQYLFIESEFWQIYNWITTSSYDLHAYKISRKLKINSYFINKIFKF